MYNRQLHNKTYYEKIKRPLRESNENAIKNEGGSTTNRSRESRDRK